MRCVLAVHTSLLFIPSTVTRDRSPNRGLIGLELALVLLKGISVVCDRSDNNQWVTFFTPQSPGHLPPAFLTRRIFFIVILWDGNKNI